MCISTFPRTGGKNGKIANAISSAFPYRGIAAYMEPYGGSFGVGCHLLAPYPTEIYNDLDIYCYTVMRALVLDGELLLEKVYRETKLSKEYFTYAKQIVESGFLGIDDPLEQGKLAYTVLLQSFNGNCRGWGASRSGLSEIEYKKLIENKLPLVDRLKNLTVLRQDAIDLIVEYKGRSDMLMLLDPPYTKPDIKNGITSNRVSTRDLYLHDMGTAEQIDFLKAVQGASAKIVIDGYHNSLYEATLTKENGWYCYELGEFYKLCKVSRQCGLRDVETEVIWTNYPAISTNSRSIFLAPSLLYQ